MKTQIVNIYNAQGEIVAWVKMSSNRQLERVKAEIGGPLAATLELPTEAWDLETLGCIAAGAAQEAGLEYSHEWEGRWELEPSTPEDRETEEPTE